MVNRGPGSTFWEVKVKVENVREAILTAAPPSPQLAENPPAKAKSKADAVEEKAPEKNVGPELTVQFNFLMSGLW